jgi:hypothetical protein
MMNDWDYFCLNSLCLCEWCRTPLFCAAGNGHVDTVKHLLATGANVNAVDSVGRTALHWSVQRAPPWLCISVSLNLGADGCVFTVSQC